MRQQIALLAPNMVVARKRRCETQAQWAQRPGVSQPTMARVERGDPSVATASYAMCMWVVHQAQGLADLTDRFVVLGISTSTDPCIPRRMGPCQAMVVSSPGAESSLDNALTERSKFGIARAHALALVHEVARVVSTWPAHFGQPGVRRRPPGAVFWSKWPQVQVSIAPIATKYIAILNTGAGAGLRGLATPSSTPLHRRLSAWPCAAQRPGVSRCHTGTQHTRQRPEVQRFIRVR